MSYAGGCGITSLQSASDPYFHLASIRQIYNYTRVGQGSTCGIINNTVNNIPSVAAANDTFFIPPLTSFTLAAIGSDPDSGDVLTYCWEQFNLGPPSITNQPVSPNSPRFRSFLPSISPFRTFPNLNTLVNNLNSNSEYLPDQPTTLNFTVTVRDNKASGGGIDTAKTVVQVVNSSPFSVSSPNDSVILWGANSLQVVTWNVGATNVPPITCQEVQIWFSSDGGITWPYLLKDFAPNDGVDTVLVPLVDSRRCRVMVKSIDNIFFDVSNFNFRVRRPSTPHFDLFAFSDTLFVCNGDSTRRPILIKSFFGYNSPITLSIQSNIPGLFARIEDSTLLPGDTAFIWLRANNTLQLGTRSLTILANSTIGSVLTPLTIRNVNSMPSPITFVGATSMSASTNNPVIVWPRITNAESYEVQITTDPLLPPIFTYSNIKNNFYHFRDNLQINGITYHFRVRAVNPCGVSAWSNFGSITLIPTNCITLTDTTNKIIPSQGSVSYLFDVPSTYSSNSIKKIHGVHQRFSDLKFEAQELLTGITPTLLRGQSCISDSTYFNFAFASHASSLVNLCSIQDSLLFLPQNGGVLFPWGNCNRYEVKITDMVAGASGVIYGVEMEFCLFNPSPSQLVIDTLLPPLPACVGDTVELKCAVTHMSGFDRISYRWHKNGVPLKDTIEYGIFLPYYDTLSLTLPNVSVADAGVYRLMQLGCIQTDSSNEVNLQVVPKSPAPSLFLVGDTIFTSTSGNHIWFYNGNIITGSTGNFVIAQDTGVYSVMNQQNGCFSELSSLNITGIENESLNGISIKVFPNPFQGDLFLEFSNASTSVDFSKFNYYLSDLTGRKISAFRQDLSQSGLQMKFKDLSQGIYFLTVSSGNRLKVFKLVYQD